jgi:hypothetical protein
MFGGVCGTGTLSLLSEEAASGAMVREKRSIYGEKIGLIKACPLLLHQIRKVPDNIMKVKDILMTNSKAWDIDMISSIFNSSS